MRRRPSCTATLCVLLGLVGSMQVAPAQAMGGQSTPMVLGRMVAARADAPSVAATNSQRSQYVLHCAGCHGFDGAGSPERYVPDLRRAGRWLRIDGGRAYLVKVPGLMASGLDDAQVAAVANWMLDTLARGSVPAGQPPYTADEVARGRREPLTDVAAERERLLRLARAAGLDLD